MRTRTRLPIVALAVVCFMGRARADVDLTGSWLFEFDGLGQITAVQSGTALTLQTDFGAPFTGTIDPVTGVFALVGEPSPGGVLFGPGGVPVPYGPSPAPSWNGTATADGNHFDSVMLVYFIKLTPPVDFSIFPWFGFGVPVNATRSELVVCGDGDVDPGERCDHGAGNGTDGCCSATCQLVSDADFDTVCDVNDNCPNLYNPTQEPICPANPMSLTRTRVDLRRGRARLTGVIPAAAVTAGLSKVELDAGAGSVERVVVCEPRSARRIECTDGGALKVRLNQPLGSPDLEVSASTGRHRRSLPRSADRCRSR